MTAPTNPSRPGRLVHALVLCALALALLSPAPAAAHEHEAELPPGSSEPLRPSVEPEPSPSPRIYTTDYLFAITRSVANSTLVPAARLPLYFFTIPIDTAFLPLAAIAGFFPGE